MSVSAGSRIGPYEIVSRIGVGGMGEVWRARDSRLDRSVAIKVLTREFAENEQLRLRFEREARAISQLNHPNICTLYDIGRENGTDYLVMELLEGESLADRLARGALPMPEVLRYGIQIADALDKAHRSGIVHRDLKPGNIILTKSVAKLLDFGLAKSMAASPLIAPSLVTEHKPLTQEGTIIGTFQYMAPEQLEGEEADGRTDIFAFGTVLYEMATGRRAFSGKTKTSLIAAIVQSEPPPISAIQPLTPPAFEHVVKKCLAKERDDRWQSAHDIAEELKWISETQSSAGVAVPILLRRKTRHRLLLGVAAAASIIAVVLAVLLSHARASAPRMLRTAVIAPAGMQFEPSGTDSASLTVSPDGRYVTFAASDAGGKTMLWVRPLESDNARALSGTEGAKAPFWSPDSRSIAFFSGGKLKRIDVGGGPAVALADATDGRGGTWSREGVILFAPDWRSPIYRVEQTGGPATPVTKVDASRSETTHRWPCFLPDGRHFLYLAGSHRVALTSDLNAIYVGSTDSPERKLLLRARSNALYVSGYILFVRENYLLAQPFDARKLVLNGEPIRIAENVTYESGFFRAAFGASEEGTLAYFTGSNAPTSRLAWYDRAGKEAAVIDSPLAPSSSDHLQAIRLSPDETRVALTVGDTSDIWILDLERRTRTRFTSDPMNDFAPVWSPDLSRIIYASDRDVLPALYEKPTNGLGRETLLLKASRMLTSTAWSADGKYLAMEAADPADPDSKIDVWVLPLTGGQAKPVPFIESEFTDTNGQFSHDGRWLTFVSNETGRPELYAVSFPSRREKRQLTNGGVNGSIYVWRGDGREIIYLAPDGRLMSIAVNGDTFITPKPLFKSDRAILAVDITRDGSRILAAEAERKETAPITLVTNWMSQLPR